MKGRFTYLKKYFHFFVVINFLAGVMTIFAALAGVYALMVPVPFITVIACYYFSRKSLTPAVIWMNGTILLLSGILFSVALYMYAGSISGTFYNTLVPLCYPFVGLLMIFSLVGSLWDFYIVMFGLLLLETILAFLLQRRSIASMSDDSRKPRTLTGFCTICLLAAVLLTGMDVYLYSQRPEAKYGGHGFNYMNGYSSTDFTDYTVYCDESKSKLVTLDHTPDLQISNKDEMPKMDGAEACYPVYAAIAKACYVGIDEIEKDFQKDADKREDGRFNGEIVTFTNTLNGFSRLIYKDIDLLFSARPSQDQLKEAEYEGVELEITPIGKEAFVFFVEADNPVDNLTSDQVRSIYHGDINNWAEVGGKDQEIRAFQRPAGSGSQTMMEYFMGDISLKEPDTYDTISSMEGVISNVAQYANEDGAMGYSFRYFIEGLNQEKNVKIISIDGVQPTVETISDGSYPLVVGLCLITRKDDPNPNVQKMIDFCLSEDGQEIIQKTGYGRLEK